MPAAIGVNIAPTPISTRPISRASSVLASAHSRLPAANTSIAKHSARRRGQPPVTISAIGASTAVASAYAVIAWPAAATLICRSAPIGARIPLITNAPVPITRLHSAKR